MGRVLCGVLAATTAVWAGAAGPVAVSPGGQDEAVIIEGRCPTFSWGAVPQAASLRLAVYRLEDGTPETVRALFSVELPGAASSWTPPRRWCLETGGVYAWRVGAVGADGEVEWSGPVWFEVAGPPNPVTVDLSTTGTGSEGGDGGKGATSGSGVVASGGAGAPGAAVHLPAVMRAGFAPSFSVGPTGNVTGNVFTGDGSGLSNLQKGSVAGLTAGGVVFGGAGLAQDAANFFWDDTNNRLGLGTNTPNEQLELTGNLRLAGYGAQIQFGASRFLHATGSLNTWVGEGAGRVSNTGYQNVGVGYHALSTEATGGYGYHNTAVGSYALAGTSTGSANTAVGFWALKSNTTADNNAAFGELALQNNTTGTSNTGLGSYALMNNTTASRNTAVGINALYTQSFANGDVVYDTDNTAVGADALRSNQPTNAAGTSGNANTAVGSGSLYANSTGFANTALGYHAMWANTTGQANTAVGYNALLGAGAASSWNTAVGGNAGYNASGSYGVFVGFGAGYSETSSHRLHIANSSAKTLIYGQFDSEVVVIADKTPGVSKGLDVNGYLRARSWAPDASIQLCRNTQGVLGDCGQQPAPAAAGSAAEAELERLRQVVADQQALIAELARRLEALEAAANPRP